jgi:BirA family transcriptional regulator, biotin operon repressor / biotin---[acetyl-CoA-carboxylase] ligase
MISADQIKDTLTTNFFGKHIFVFESIDSTNNLAKSLSQSDAPHGTVVFSEEQTAGRGRLQRSWISEKGKNLLFSIIVYPSFGRDKIGLLPFTAAVAVCDAIEQTTSLIPKCKWPNDILINGKKVCGMLLEATGTPLYDKIILGIGLNVNQTEFSDDLQLKATSLKNEIAKEIDRVDLLQKILGSFEIRYEQLSRFPSQFTLEDWKRRTEMFGAHIIVYENDVAFEATAIDIAFDGSLVIELKDKSRRNIFSGDVTLVENYT